MAIKLVATDMDGTFLRTDKTYDRVRFSRLYEHMQELGCRFVVASGNQFFQVRDFFPEVGERIAYAVCNGTYVWDAGELVRTFTADPGAVTRAIEVFDAMPDVDALLVGEHAAYARRDADPAFVEDLGHFFTRMERVDDLREVNDGVLMFSCVVAPEREAAVMRELDERLAGALIPVSSGDGYFDLLIPGVNKAVGLQVLMDRWGIDAGEVAAFGDSYNDVEMLRMAGHAYAMGQAPDDIKEVAGNVAPTNDEDGELVVLEGLLGL